jgi:hypothetical protein
VLGVRGWCENEMAAAAVRAAVADKAGMTGADAPVIRIVADGFTLDPKRMPAGDIAALPPDGVAPYLAGGAAAPDRITIVISDIHVTNTPGPGDAVAQGSATITYYRGGAVTRTESVRGKLVGRTFTITERK